MFYARFEWEEPKGSKVYKIIQNYGMDYISTNSARIEVDAFPFDGSQQYKDQSVSIRVYVPILEDFAYEVKSSFQDIKDVLSEIPLLGKILDLFATLNKLQAGTTGQTNDNAEFMKFQTWASTEPFKMSLKGVFDTRQSSFFDSYLPAHILMNQNIISIVSSEESQGNLKLFVPGISMKDVRQIIQQRKTKESPGQPPPSAQTDTKDSGAKDFDSKDVIQSITSGSSKTIKKFEIITRDVDDNEVILLSVGPCFIETAKPTLSKEQTTTGLPLWIELDINVQSVFSASDSMFTLGPELDNSFGEPSLLSSAGVTSAVNSAFR